MDFRLPALATLETAIFTSTSWQTAIIVTLLCATKVERALDDLFAQVLAWGGVITGEHGIGLAKKRWWPEATSEVARDLHRRLKQALDPDGILNPGKFL